jgi:thioredoxin reductase (NADPH)
MTAGLYAARNGLDALLLERGLPGGQMASSEEIENCPGCVEGSGAVIGQRMLDQATRFGLRVHHTQIERLSLQGDEKTAETSEGTFRARAAIITLGAQARQLGVPGEAAFFGRGVSTCATCDGPFYRDKVVAVIGGGDAAVQEAAFLTRFARKVIVVHRRQQFRAEQILQQRLLASPRIELRMNRRVAAILGADRVAGLLLEDVDSDHREELAVDGVFVFVGFLPNTRLLQGQVDLDQSAYVRTDAHMHTNVERVYAAGDVRAGATPQIVTSAADGAIAAMTLTHDLAHAVPANRMTRGPARLPAAWRDNRQMTSV